MTNCPEFCLPKIVFIVGSFFKVILPEFGIHSCKLPPYPTLSTLFHGLLESIGADENSAVSLTTAYLERICISDISLEELLFLFHIL